ncbi:F-box domain-containing protein [Mycena sanguinolenta]|uniref:F-box domain-containing protein n=1 Tax=Mycena sanguinolenta TaxID=230812 RepID=A0A8H6YCJ1_9AGAR|nr:F-box domain-containing protein [Mycena sanguinolenta]
MASLCSSCDAALILTSDAFNFSLTTDPRTLVRFLHLSSTNEPPLEPESSIVRPIAEKTSARLAALDAELSRLKGRVRELEDERAPLSGFHAQNMRILWPMRRIPPEILGEIFSWTLPSAYDIFDIEDCPWILTCVCASWRALAPSKPSLWSLIVIDFTNKTQYPLEMIRIQLKRARLLKIHFFGDEMCESPLQIALFTLLAGSYTQWEELNIRLTSDLVPILMDLCQDPRALRKVRVQWDTAESQPSEYNSVDFLRTAISLVDISVHCEYQFLPTRLPVVHHLTRYDFDAPWTTHAQLLRSLPNLEEVRICREFDSSLDWPHQGPHPGQPIELLRLQRLFVNASTSLDYLRAPSLEEIAIQLPGDTHAESTATRHSLRSRLSYT